MPLARRRSFTAHLRLALAIALCLSLSGALTTRADDAGSLSDRLDAYLSAEMRANRLPGLVVGIVQGENVLFLQGYGQAGPGRAMTPETRLYIASVSKSFTALAIMQLVEDGQISLDAPVQTYLPWFTIADPDVAARITIRDLLHHTSGLGEEGYPVSIPGPDVSLEQSVRDLEKAHPIADPGERFQYFNDNYSILGMVVQAVSGVSYEEYLANRVLDPLEMTRTVMDPAQAADLARGYGLVLGWPVPRQERYVPAHVSTGFIISTARDMTHYLIAQLNGGQYMGTRILSAESVAAMHTPGTANISDPSVGYAMGWYITEIDGISAITHSGDLANYRAEVVLLPEHDVGIVLLANQNSPILWFGVYPRLIRSIVSAVMGGTPSAGQGLVLLGWLLTALIALNVFGVARRLLGVAAWARHVVQGSAVQIVLGTGGPFFVSILLLALPRIIGITTGRVPGWGLLFQLAPDLIAWAWFGIATNAMLGTLRMRALWSLRLASTAIDG